MPIWQQSVADSSVFGRRWQPVAKRLATQPEPCLDFESRHRDWSVIRSSPLCLKLLLGFGDIFPLNDVPELEETQMAKAAGKKSEKLVPLGDRVVVKRAEAETKTLGGIVLPDSAKDKPQRGEVLAVGEGYVRRDGKKVALTVKSGDRILFSSYAGDEIKVGDETYLLMRESDILATF